jgi:hypothetical protein
MTKDEKHIEALKKYIQEAEQRAKYSIERFDILIISLSSGGIALSVGLFDKFKNEELSTVFYGILFFTIALILNLNSQITGYYANRNDIKFCHEEINELEEKKHKSDYQKYDCYKNVFNFFTKVLNTVSFMALVVALIFIILFFKNIK